MSTTNQLCLEQHEMWFTLSGIVVLRPKRRIESQRHPRWIYLGRPEYILPGPLAAAGHNPAAGLSSMTRPGLVW
jgi:hypothetical protein